MRVGNPAIRLDEGVAACLRQPGFPRL